MARRNKAVEMGPLGPGNAPSVDPLKGVRGVMAGTHILEAIVILLVLTVIARVDEGAHASTFNYVFIIGLGVAMVAAAFMQRASWALHLNVCLQVLAVATFIVHPAAGVCGLMFAAVWWYIYHLKGNMEQRMALGLLPTQHLDADGNLVKYNTAQGDQR